MLIFDNRRAHYRPAVFFDAIARNRREAVQAILKRMAVSAGNSREVLCAA